ncbi:hypothetical protein ACLB2K_020933 [Fragaria x ananassa]
MRTLVHARTTRQLRDQSSISGLKYQTWRSENRYKKSDDKCNTRLTAGYSNMHGYVGYDKGTAKPLDKDTCGTGDICSFDDEGLM